MIISEIKKLIMEKSISLVIIRGCSGSGKSTLAKLLGSNFKHFEADMYFMKNGVYQFDGTKLGAAHG